MTSQTHNAEIDGRLITREEMIGTLQRLVPGWHAGTAAARLSPTSTVRAVVLPA